MGNKIFIHFLLIACLSVSFFYGSVCAETKPIGSGAKFHDLIFNDTLSKKEQTYLGIPKQKNFSFKDIPGTLFLIDVFSVYCISCQKQVPIFHQVYSWIENDPELKGNVKMIGIAAGNNRKEVESFKKQYQVPYPIFTDPAFVAHKKLGNPAAPYTIFVMRDARGKYIVVSTHKGKFDSAESIMNEIKDFLQCAPSTSACDYKLKGK